MSNAGSKIAKNAGILFVSQLITWVLTLLFTIIFARYLGAALVGEFTLATTVWNSLGVFISFGMDTLITKQVARSPAKTPELLCLSIVARLLLFLLSWAIVGLYIFLAGVSNTTLLMIGILGLAHIFGQIYTAAQSALQGLELMQYVSLAGIVSRLLNTILGITALILGYGIFGIAVVTIITMLAGMCIELFYVNRHYQLRLQINLRQIYTLLRDGLPYLLSGLGLAAYGQVDVLIISLLVSTTEVGWYGSASQLFGTLMFFPVIFTTALFPALARSYGEQSDALPHIMSKSFNLMFMLSIPIGFGVFVIAHPLVLLLYGQDFAQSGPVLALMGLVLIPMYQNILLGQFLTSADRQNAWTIIMVVATILTIGLDTVLVPLCHTMFGNGAIAGAISFLITELAMLAAGIYLLPKGSLGSGNFRTIAQTFCAGLVMVAAIWWLRDLFLPIPILIGTLTYVGAILLLQVLPSEDLAVCRQLALKALQRLRRRTNPISIEGV